MVSILNIFKVIHAVDKLSITRFILISNIEFFLLGFSTTTYQQTSFIYWHISYAL